MGVRARIIDRLTEAVRAPREVARLRAQCERLRKKRDAAITERDARISTDIDGAQAWAVEHGMSVGSDNAGWFCRDDYDGGMVAGGGRSWVVGQAVGRVLARTWGRYA